MNKGKIFDFAFHILEVIIVLGICFYGLIKFELISLKSSALPMAMILNHDQIGLKEGASYQLQVSVYPKNVNYNEIKWSSSDESIASVSADGVVKANKSGTVLIKAEIALNNLEVLCIVNVSKNDVLVQKIDINNEEINILKGDTHVLSYTLTPNLTNTLSFDYISSDNSIVVVNEKGIIKAVNSGKAIITVKSLINGVRDDVLVTVFDENNLNNLNNADLVKEKIEISLGTSVKLAMPNSLKNANWYTKDRNIAIISKNGVITSVKEGGVDIIATSINGFAKLYEVKVKDKVDTKKDFDILKDNLKLIVGDKYELDYSFFLDKKEALSIKWSSTNEEVAIVNDGVVMAIGEGKATVSASSGKFQDEIIVEVKKEKGNVSLERIYFQKDFYEVVVNDTINLIPNFMPVDANKELTTWDSSDPNIAIVSDGFVKFLKEGEVIITNSSDNISSSVKFLVNDVFPSVITIEDKGVIDLSFNETKYLIRKILPSNATNTRVSWHSSNEEVVSVSDNGLIKGLKKGSAEITVKTINDKFATVKINVS